MAGRKKKESGGGGSPAWMSTFSDLMNLLLCFFVLLFSMSSVDSEKYQEVAAALAQTFSIFDGGGSALEQGILISSGASQLNELATFYNSMGMNSEGDISTEIKDAVEQVKDAGQKLSEQMADSIEAKLEAANIAGDVEVTATSKYVMLNLNSGVLFDSGRAELKSGATILVGKVADILYEYNDNTISIEGHTDNVPISTSQYEDNTMLSLYRAYSVFSYFVYNKGFDPSSMISSGRGESVPIATNSTAEGRSQNRRVEIKVYNMYSE